MAEIRLGKNKGREVKLHQYCNDWVTVVLDGELKAMGLGQFRFTDEEQADIKTANEQGKAGIMSQLFHWEADGDMWRLIKNKKPRGGQ